MDNGIRCYDYNSLRKMNCTSTWRGCIKISEEKNKSGLYQLYPTGNEMRHWMDVNTALFSKAR